MATRTEVRRLARAHRADQVKRAAVIAALVAAYYRARVDPEDPSSVEAWVEAMVPRILQGSKAGARASATYAGQLRRLEVPKEPRLTLEPLDGSVASQISTSLLVVGPRDYLAKRAEIERLDIAPREVEGLLREAKEVTARKVAASTVRHAQSGGRATLIGATRQDSTVIGWVRVTRDKPCFFCAMLASRGVVYAEDSFDLSDSSFRGAGEFKVHDECQCSLKPVRDRKEDPLVADSEKFADMWKAWGAGGTVPSGERVDTRAALRFRRGYDHWLKTGEMLNWDVVASTERFRAR